MVLCLIFNLVVSGQPWTTVANGNWSNPATWTANAVPPTSGNLGTVTIGHNVALDQHATLTTLNLTAGVFTIAGGNTFTVTGTATVSNGAVFTNSASNAANVSIAHFIVSDGGTYNHDAVGSSANGATTDFPGSSSRSFGASSNVVIKKWANGGNIPVALPASGSPGWGNLTIDVSSLGGTWGQSGGLTKVQGDMTIKNTGGREMSLFKAQSGGTTFSKNVYLEGGILCILQTGSGNGLNINIEGDLILSNTGRLTLTSGSFSFFSTSEPRVFLKGNLSIANSAQILQPNTFGVVASLVFKKTNGIQTYTCTNPTGISQALIGWGIGNENESGTHTNTLRLLSNFIASDLCVFRIFKNATLECPGETFVSGAGAPIVSPAGFTLYDGGTLKIGSIDGIKSSGDPAPMLGNIRTSGARNFNSNANYIYTGAVNQVTGSGLPDIITGSLSIANTGAAGNNVITLTKNNTETRTLNLNSGYFAAGINQTLKISNNGTVNGVGGGDCVYLTANGGNIHLLGNNAVTGAGAGRPRFYDVTIGSAIANSPVTFTQNGTIYHYCTLNNEGRLTTQPPTYATGSTLIYNSGGTYARDIEWGNTSGLAGYPHHVTVQNSTVLNLNSNPVTPETLEMAGDLIIGNPNGKGEVYLNSNMAKPLTVLGSVIIGAGGASNSVLQLSSSPGGDFYLYGNFSRYNNSFYADNNRTIFFKGNANATISTPGVAITPGIPSQYFSHARIEKSIGSEIVTLACPVGISQEISFTKGIVLSSATNLLSITNPATASVMGGSNLSYVNGPMARAVNSPADYYFPVGKPSGANKYRPISVIPSSTSTSGFQAEYFTGPTPNNATLLSNITSLENNEYWQVNRTSGSVSARVKLNYENPGTGLANWTPVDPCASCRAAVAQYNTSGTGYWEFTLNPGTADPNLPEVRPHLSNGTLYSASLSAFSLQRPFTAAVYLDIILPLKLSRFRGTLVGADAYLQWELSDAGALHVVEIQQGSDGKQFATVSTLAPKGDGGYAFLQKNTGAGNYFRLKLIDRSGGITLSPVIHLHAPSGTSILAGLQQNPLKRAILPVIFSGKPQAASFFVIDGTGRVCKTYRVPLQQGWNKPVLDAVGLPVGLYFLKILLEDANIFSERFLKQ